MVLYVDGRNSSNDISQVLKEKNHQPKTLCPEKTSFWNVREIKTFSDERIKGLCLYQTYPKKLLKEVLKKEQKKEGILQHQERGENSSEYKSLSKNNRLSSFEFSESCLIVKQKL